MPKIYNDNGLYSPKYINENQITNCLLEVPQRFQLDLNDGRLTLKAGSICIFPNGFEADGTTPKFDYLTVPTDKSNKPAYTRTGGIIYVNSNFSVGDYLYAYSGPTAPTGQQYMLWYDTANNLVKRTNNSGATWTSNCSLPLGVVNCGPNGYTAIPQKFHGMGYIGSTAWVDKGVKGLAPNFRNGDGSLNNVVVESPKVQVYTNLSTDTTTGVAYVLQSNGKIGRKTNSTYDAARNINVTQAGVDEVFCKISTCQMSGGVISSFAPILPFCAADAQDIDGKWNWVSKNLIFNGSLAVDALQTFDLSDILSDPRALYEVIFMIHVRAGVEGTSVVLRGAVTPVQYASMVANSGHGQFLAYAIRSSGSLSDVGVTTTSIYTNTQSIRFVNTGTGVASSVYATVYGYRKVR